MNSLGTDLSLVRKKAKQSMLETLKSLRAVIDFVFTFVYLHEIVWTLQNQSYNLT